MFFCNSNMLVNHFSDDVWKSLYPGSALNPQFNSCLPLFFFSYTHAHTAHCTQSAKYVTFELYNSPLLAHYLILLAHYHSRQPDSH